MLSATNALFNELFGVVLPAFLGIEAIQYLIGVIIFSIIISVLLRFFKRK